MIRPEIGLSDSYLDLSVETGTSFERSFIVYSRNGQELSGKVLSTNDKLVPVVTELSGTECEIPFYFKGKMAIPREEHYGDFLLLTNGGEFNIPFCVAVSSRKYRFGDQIIADLDEFYEFAQKDWKKAKDLFFMKDFPDIMLAEQEEYRTLYHDLLKGFSKDMILEQFLMETMKKEPVRIYADREALFIKEGNVGRFLLTKKGWGCLDGRLYGASGDLYVNIEKINQDAFEEDKIEIFVSFKEGAKKDTLMIETAFEKIAIPVHREIKKQQEEIHIERENRKLAQLLRHFIDFRIGKTEAEDFIARSMKLYPFKGLFYELYCMLLLLVRERITDEETEECREYGQKIEEKQDIYVSDPECRSFYYYVMALWKKEKDYTKKAVHEVRKAYEDQRSWKDYLTFITMDETIAFHYEAQWDELVHFLEQGINSPFLYLAILDVLNQEPYLLEQLGSYKTYVIRWGLRHQYLSQKLIEQFARLSIREKCFKKDQLPILQKIYDRKPDELYLKAICSMLMKGNKREKEYHVYFEEAVKKHLNLIGLNEFYLRSLDFDTYPVLPKLILYYFHYSSSLDKREKAWLYLNILRNREAYEDIYDNYAERIEAFVKEQLMEGRVNRYLKQLYEMLLPSLLEEPELAKYIPNVIFKRRLSCPNPMMEGVYVCHPENEEEVHVSFVEGLCQIEIYSDAARIYFADRMGNRYHSGIKYQMEAYLDEEVYRDFCLTHIRDDRRVYVKWVNGDPDDKKEQLARLLAENDELKSWKTEKAVERILDYHYVEKTMEDLSECLDKINYRVISPSYRRTLMNYYMACNRMEDAYFGVELYGSDLMDPEQLYMLTCAGLCLHKEEQDDLLLTMAYKSFVNRKYNREILSYLQKHFHGRIFDLIDLWNVLKDEGMLTAEFEEKVLRQIAFVGSKDKRMFDVILSYLTKVENREWIEDLLTPYSTRFLLQGFVKGQKQKKQEPEGYFKVLDRLALEDCLKSDLSRLSYLYHKAETGYGETEKRVLYRMVREFSKKEIILPFFEKFAGIVTVPALWRESVFFLFTGEENQEYDLFVISDFEEESRKSILKMREIVKGLYYGSFYKASFEVIRQVGVKGYEGGISILGMDETVLGSRNHLLTKIKEEKGKSGSLMADYEKILSRMKEQLKFLSDR